MSLLLAPSSPQTGCVYMNKMYCPKNTKDCKSDDLQSFDMG